MFARVEMDVNCDLGESFGNWRLGDDEGIMPLVTTANIACGFHGGDPLVMSQTAALAKRHGVAAGAHPGYPDLLGFGRREYKLRPEEAAAYFRYQVGALRAFLEVEGLPLHHVKPHGAMAFYLREDDSVATAVADAIAGFGEPMMFYFPAPIKGVALCEALAERGVRVVGEVYPDLSYDAEGNLLIQREKRETPLDFAASQVARFLADGVVAAEDGSLVPIEAESICVHGDGPNAVQVATAIRETVEAAGRRLEALQA